VTEEPESSEPRTVGEVRRRLAEIGNPWTVDPALGDDDPLPVYHRGGQPADQTPAGLLPTPVEPGADLTELITAMPPSNPFLRARWTELGLLPAQGTASGGDRP
jgi:hypothetical protein